MMCIWSHRPPSLHLALFVVAYVLGCGLAQALAIVPGTGVSIWPPGGLFMATLILAPIRSWPWWVLAGCAGEMTGQILWFHSPPAVGLLIYAGNAVAAMFGAWILNRTFGRPIRLETLQEVLAFVVLGAGAAPVLSATVGTATLVGFGIKANSFSYVWPLFWIGDATGILIVAPLTLVLLQNWQGRVRFSTARWVEAGVVGLIFFGVAAFSLSGYLPFAYTVMPPLLWAAVRFEFRGAVVALPLLAVITGAFTVYGVSEFAGDPASQRDRQIMLHVFLGVSAFSALIVAAISRQHQLAVRTLRQSEISLRDLVATLPVQIWCGAADGKPIYFSRQFRDFTGFNVEEKDVEGTPRLSSVLNAIIHPDDLGTISTLYAHALATGQPLAATHRMRRFDGKYRWVETRASAMRDGNNAIVQWNGVCLDIDDQVRAEEELRRASDRLAQATQAASLAELSASIAHEVNQPLAAIVANSHACRRWLSAETPNIERAKITVERITRDANSAAEVVSRIRSLFKQSAATTRTSSALGGVVVQARNLMADEAAQRRVRINVDVEGNLPSVAIDRIQIQQVLVNLIRNGIEAMDSASDDRVIGLRVRRLEDAVCTEVSDLGRGIETTDGIFEPFVTTKEHGMGMGLAIARSIVKTHGGRLWAEGNDPRGAKFIFTLPVEAATSS
jgi:PAS domain S-box-containing protein